MEALTPILALGIIGLVALLIYESYEIRNLRQASESLEDLTADYVAAFGEVKRVINTNAASLRTTHRLARGHDVRIEVLSTLVDILLDTASINPSLRRKIEAPLDDLDVEGLIDEDELPSEA